MEKIMRAAIYARARCNSDTEREERIKEQIGLCMRYAELKNFGVDSDHIYLDAERLGTQTDRTGLKKLLHDAHSRLFDAILVEDFLRFPRNMNRLSMIIKELSNEGVSLIAVADNHDMDDEMSKLSFLLKS
jgi:DNA invertase Pin-like site-specific DNA recombinase